MSACVFEYFYTQTAMGELEVEDVGNFAILANDDNGLFYGIVVKTNLGMTRVFQYGPAAPDFTELPKTVDVRFERLDYNEGKIQKIVQSYLNSFARKITQAMVVDESEVYGVVRNIADYMADDNAF